MVHKVVDLYSMIAEVCPEGRLIKKLLNKEDKNSLEFLELTAKNGMNKNLAKKLYLFVKDTAKVFHPHKRTR